MESLGRRGYAAGREPVRQGVQYLLHTQERNGSWYGRWGVDYIYGTFLALRGLRAANETGTAAAMRLACDWVATIQNRDGGWGESCASYLKNEFVPGPSTPSQTAWGILALLAGGDRGTAALDRGIRYLLETQGPDGQWEESLATGTGFPNVFYLRYGLYRNYFPLMALTYAGETIGR